MRLFSSLLLLPQRHPGGQYRVLKAAGIGHSAGQGPGGVAAVVLVLAPVSIVLAATALELQRKQRGTMSLVVDEGHLLGALLGGVSLHAGDMQQRPGPRGASGQPQCQRWGASASLKPGSHSVSPAAAGLAGPEGENGNADTPTTNPDSVALSCPALGSGPKPGGGGHHAHPPWGPRCQQQCLEEAQKAPARPPLPGDSVLCQAGEMQGCGVSGGHRQHPHQGRLWAVHWGMKAKGSSTGLEARGGENLV